ncbi:MAG: Sec-independent protein translocase protein TatA [Marmoricola sp.]|nr:Sec-independent protein translocase protein TatA [Marmoricola sp.]
MLRNGLEPWHIIVLLAVVLLVFGGKKLPELARGSGRALRIFKAETKGVFTDDEDAPAKTAGQLDAGATAHPTDAAAPAAPAQASPPVEPDAVRRDAGTD